jgi:ribosomal protein S18 acetylase RimI-like enzyme
MNVLIDTNILIPMEDTNRILNPSLAEIKRLSEQLGHNLYIHPTQRDDINRDANERRRDIVLSRLGQYQSIESPPTLSDTELRQYGWNQVNDNDRVDNLLLHALCRGAVHLLITNDEKIHKKAKAIEFQEQVHHLDQFLFFLKSQISIEPPPPCGVRNRFLYEIDVKQPFFDSLRENYESFDKWYESKSRDHRKSWCIISDTNVQAICIYKKEIRPNITDEDHPLDGDALKLCTFKVGEDVRGRKLGERLLYSAFKYASNQKIPYVYLQVRGKEHEKLVSLCVDYGFKFMGKYKKDDVYLKIMTIPHSVLPDTPSLDYAIAYYPHYLDGDRVRKYIVPIRPEYHNDLFADTSDVARGLFVNDPGLYNPQSNTIKKVYICHANIKHINPGSLLLFYRTCDRKSIECLGIVEKTYRGRDVDAVLPLISKRTVFTKAEILTFLQKETLIILFRFIGAFSPINFKSIQNAGIKGPIRRIREITHEQFRICMENKDKP